ncbi:MAG: aminotransferase class V-fold PLP-dependent enzyme [Eubacteriales bacterium]
MDFKGLYTEMKEQFASTELFDHAKEYACIYMQTLMEMDVFPSDKTLESLCVFDEVMPESPESPSKILDMLHQFGSKAAVASTGGKYFGFVVGSITPTALAAKWLADVWDQNSALYVMSPIASKLEEVCERWLTEMLALPSGTAAGFVSGSSTAIFCALAAARNHILNKQGWDVTERGLFGAPAFRVVIGEQAHSSVWKSLALLGIGKGNTQIVPADEQGRMKTEALPPLDCYTLVITQAGNVNSGAFDPIDEICNIANRVNAWVHVDGAFGLWAAASKKTCHLTKGIEKADSWSVDAHKTINAPYDCGIVWCKDRLALAESMQATGSYIQFSEHRDGMLFTPEMSRRARSIELWATLKYLGRSGIEALVDHLCELAKYFAEQLSKNDFVIENDIVFNQILFRSSKPEETTALLKKIQASGKCWCGGTTWDGMPVIRISVCSWRTTEKEVNECVSLFTELRNKVVSDL